MNLLAIDVGFGSTKISYVEPSGTLKMKKYITALAKKQNSGIFTDDDSVELNGVSYLCFNRALNIPGQQQIQVTDFESLNLATPIFIKKIEKDLGIQFDAVVAGLSIAMTDQQKTYHDSIATNLGLPSEKVMVLQQGVGGWAAYQNYGLDPYSTVQNDTLMQNYLLIDIGHNTMDVLSILDGKLSEDTVDGITGAGTTWIASKLIQHIMKEYKLDITPVNAREMIDKRSFKFRGTTVDLTGILNEIAYEYCSFIINTIESKFAQSMMNRDGLLFIGGTSYVIQERMTYDPRVAEMFKARYGSYFINIPKQAEFYNSSGYYILAKRIFAARGIV